MLWRPDLNTEGGPFKVILKRGEFVDETRLNEDGSVRVVPYKIYVPVDHGQDKLPVIIWSHGFGGNHDGAGFLSRYLASFGYYIVHITHRGTDSSLWEGQPGHPWDILRQVKVSRKTSLLRFSDVPFAIDQLQKWAVEPENEDIGRHMDFDILGMSGHSFGAMTTQVMAGMLYPNEDGDLTRYKEDRFKAGILYSPVPIRHLVKDEPDDVIYGSIDLPLLHMTGTEDLSPIEGFGHERRMLVYKHSSSPEKFILIKSEGDHMVYNGTRGKLGASDLRERHENIIKATALAYWDYKLKGDENAKAWLEGEGVQNYLSSDAEFMMESA